MPGPSMRMPHESGFIYCNASHKGCTAAVSPKIKYSANGWGPSILKRLPLSAAAMVLPASRSTVPPFAGRPSFSVLLVTAGTLFSLQLHQDQVKGLVPNVLGQVRRRRRVHRVPRFN